MMRVAKKPKILKAKSEIFTALVLKKELFSVKIISRSYLGYFTRISFVVGNKLIESSRQYYVRRSAIDYISFSYSDSGKTLTLKEIKHLYKIVTNPPIINQTGDLK